jgi:hypothetical protein
MDYCLFIQVVSWNIKKKEIKFTDSGRLCRPIFYVDNKKVSFKNKRHIGKNKYK